MITARSAHPVPEWLDAPTIASPRQPVEPTHSHDEATLHLRVEWPTPGVVAVRIGGEVDLGSLPRLGEMIRQRVRGAALQRLILDFTDVSYASSAVIELLMTARAVARQREITLLVVPGDGAVARLLTLTRVGPLFQRCPDLTTAVTTAEA